MSLRTQQTAITITTTTTTITITLQVGKNASKKERFGKNILSGGCAGSLSLLFVQSIDYTRWSSEMSLKQTENIFLQNTTRGGCKAARRGEAVLWDDGRLRQDDQGGRLDGTVSRFRHILHLYLHLQVVDISISLSKINGKL